MISGQVAASPVVLFPCCLLPLRGNEWALRDDLVSDGLDDFRGAVWREQMHEVVSILAITMIPGSRVRNLSFQKQIGRSFWSRHVSLAHPLEILIYAVVDRLIVVDSPKVGQNLVFGRVLMCINVKDDAADIISFAGGSAPHQQTIIIAAQQQQLQMSFFPTEKRRILETTPVNPLGPGKYYSRDDLHHQRPAYAPFGSLSSKKPTSKDSAGIGPGQYNISSPIIRPSITKYENKNIIIVKVNDQGGHQFKSRTNRFIQQHSHTEAGPGSYELDHSPSPPRVRSSSLHPKSKLADRVRAINRQFCQERKPTLLSDPPAQQLREGRGRSQSGGKGVVNWGLNHRQRFDLLVKQPFDQNDKRKALSQFSASRKKKVRPSAVFASKSIKSHLETQIYKTNNSFKAELRKMIDYKDQQPGPGSYEPITPTAGPRVLPRFQFFGSTVQRFPQPEEQVVGPGLYEVGNKIEKTQPRQSISFSEDRHSYLGKNFTPGPGSYEVERAVIGTSFSEKELEPPFGSQQPRFNYKQKEEQTEMEEAAFVMKSYFKEKQAKREEQIKLLKKIAQDHPSAVFTSQTKRFEGKLADVSTVDVGSYDITQNDITSKVAKHQKLIQQLEECQLHKPPFLSGNPRFKQPQKHESEHRNCWCQVKSVEKQMIDHESPVFISNDRRTTFEQVYKAPPVGYYQSQQQTMIKDSFNSRFRKKQQNAVKKDAKRNRDMSKRLQTQPNPPIGSIGKTVQ